MKIFCIFSLIFILIASLSYAENLDLDLYQEENRAKNFGNIRASPGELIEAFVYAENENQDRTDDSQDIEDIEISLMIENIDDGGDFEEEFDSFDLRARQDEDLKFQFRIPYRVRDDSYRIHIEALAIEDNEDIEVNEDFTLFIDKENHKIRFDELEFSRTDLRCNEVANLNLRLLNIGRRDETVRFHIENEENEFALEREIYLESYPGDDIYEMDYPIKVPDNIAAGEYIYHISLQYSGLIDREQRSLTISCNGQNPIEDDEEPDDLPDQDTEQDDAAGTPSGNDQPDRVVIRKESNANLLLVVLLGIAVLLAIVFLVILKKK